MTRRGPKPRPPAERFWPKVDVGEPNECWEWKASKRNGYGQFRVRRMPSLRMGAHRFAWTVTHGKIPAGMCVLHKCDNPPCCNPSHLLLGNHADNMVDMVRKGRANRPCGMRNGSAKLTEEQVYRIRWLYATGNWTQESLGEIFDVNYRTIGLIVRRERWEWLK